MRAHKPRSGSEQPTNQGSVVICTTPVDCQVRTIPTFQRAVARSFTQLGQVGDLNGCGHDWATAVVATRNASKFRNMPPKKPDLFSVLHHPAPICSRTKNHIRLTSPGRRPQAAGLRSSSYGEAQDREGRRNDLTQLQYHDNRFVVDGSHFCHPALSRSVAIRL